MRRRLYFLLPDLGSAKQSVEDLLLARVEARHIHVLGRRGADLGDLPEASVFQKTDLVHGPRPAPFSGPSQEHSWVRCLSLIPPARFPCKRSRSWSVQ